MKPFSKLFACMLFILLTVGSNAFATQYALLVGVSDYPKITPLKGPLNDVKLMRDVLVEKGFKTENIQILADGLDAAPLPTRANILNALDRLLERAQPGDYVYLHFSGHGSQQAATPQALAIESEPDGKSEIFLPLDIGNAMGGETVPNAIVDYEFGQYLDRFLTKGVFIWSVFDACHSATLMRGGDEFTYRYVAPALLGIGKSKSVAPMASNGFTTRGTANAEAPLGLSYKPHKKGGHVAFYGAQTDQLAPEGLMPRGVDSKTRQQEAHGVLTYTLAEALQTFPNGSFRQLGQYVQQRYLTHNLFSVAPAFSGDSLDENVFLPGRSEGARQWSLKREGDNLSIAAGSLHQISKGALFALMPTALSDDQGSLGMAKAIRVMPLHTELELLEGDGTAKLDAARLNQLTVARLVRPNPNLSLRVSLQPGSNNTKIAQAIEALKVKPVEGLRVEWVSPNQEPDLTLHVVRDRIWYQLPGNELQHEGKEITPSSPLPATAEELATQLGNYLQKVAKVSNLVRMADSMSQSGGSIRGFTLELTHRAKDRAAATPLSTDTPIHEGDKICFKASNGSYGYVDLTILLIDSAFSIQPFFPQAGRYNRIGSGDSPDGCFDVSEPFGLDRMVVFAVPVSFDSERVDMTFLAQDGFTAETTRGIRGDTGMLDLEMMYAHAAFGEHKTRDATRGQKIKTASPEASVQLIQWISQP